MRWQPSRKLALELLAVVILAGSAVITTADLGLPRLVIAWLGVAIIIAKALEHRYQQQAMEEAHNAPSPTEDRHVSALQRRITELQQQNAALRRFVTPGALYPTGAPATPEPPVQGETPPSWQKEEDQHE